MEHDASLNNGVLMNWNRLAIRLTIAAKFFILSVSPGLAQDTRATDDFAGLKFTDDQKAKVDEVHQHMATRKDAVIKSDKLNAEQKEAMIAGLGRMERGQIVKLLTPEQQQEVLKKVRAGHAGAQEKETKRSLPQ
jgi:hypothetical protein